MKTATFTVTIHNVKDDASLARMCLFASRALDHQAKVEGLTTEELIDGNVAHATVTAVSGLTAVEFTSHE